MNKNLPRFMILLTLAAIVCLPSLASADYIQTWTENGLYGSPATYQTWDKAEAFLLSGNTWAGSGLTISLADWTTTIINPQYAVATTIGPAFNSSTQGNFYFTTDTTALIGTFSFDWVLSYQGHIIWVDSVTGTPSAGWTATESAPANAPDENRSPVPLPPSVMLLGSALVGLVLLRGRNRVKS
jgi:hypothetical protein